MDGDGVRPPNIKIAAFRLVHRLLFHSVFRFDSFPRPLMISFQRIIRLASLPSSWTVWTSLPGRRFS